MLGHDLKKSFISRQVFLSNYFNKFFWRWMWCSLAMNGWIFLHNCFQIFTNISSKVSKKFVNPLVQKQIDWPIFLHKIFSTFKILKINKRWMQSLLAHEPKKKNHVWSFSYIMFTLNFRGTTIRCVLRGFNISMIMVPHHSVKGGLIWFYVWSEYWEVSKVSKNLKIVIGKSKRFIAKKYWT